MARLIFRRRLDRRRFFVPSGKKGAENLFAMQE
jgi:hypothetical protein